MRTSCPVWPPTTCSGLFLLLSVVWPFDRVLSELNWWCVELPRSALKERGYGLPNPLLPFCWNASMKAGAQAALLDKEEVNQREGAWLPKDHRAALEGHSRTELCRRSAVLLLKTLPLADFRRLPQSLPCSECKNNDGCHEKVAFWSPQGQLPRQRTEQVIHPGGFPQFVLRDQRGTESKDVLTVWLKVTAPSCSPHCGTAPGVPAPRPCCPPLPPAPATSLPGAVTSIQRPPADGVCHRAQPLGLRDRLLSLLLGISQPPYGPSPWPSATVSWPGDRACERLSCPPSSSL
nr:uncharacterized protein LOC114099643 [Marmota flaviventris]